MPYKTKFERQKTEWMTLAQAVEYIKSVEDLSDPARDEQTSPPIESETGSPAMAWLWLRDSLLPRTPIDQLRAALQDDEIPIKWAQDKWPTSHSFFPNQPFAPDDPPTGGFWRYAQIDCSANYAVL